MPNAPAPFENNVSTPTPAPRNNRHSQITTWNPIPKRQSRDIRILVETSSMVHTSSPQGSPQPFTNTRRTALRRQQSNPSQRPRPYHYHRASYCAPPTAHGRLAPYENVQPHNLSMEQILMETDPKGVISGLHFQQALSGPYTLSPIMDEPPSPTSDTDALCPFSPTGRSRSGQENPKSVGMERQNTFSSVGYSVTNAPHSQGARSSSTMASRAIFERDFQFPVHPWISFASGQPLRNSSMSDRSDCDSITSSYTTEENEEQQDSPSNPMRGEHMSTRLSRSSIQMTLENTSINQGPETFSTANRFGGATGSSSTFPRTNTTWSLIEGEQDPHDSKKLLNISDDNCGNSVVHFSCIRKRISFSFKGALGKKPFNIHAEK